MLEQYLGLLGLLSTVVGFLVTVLSFTQYRKAAQHVREREERLPDATLFDDLRRKIVDYQAKFDDLQDDLLNAREEIGRGQAVKAEHGHLSLQIEKLRLESSDLEVELSRRKNNAESEYGRRIAELETKLLAANNAFELENGKLKNRLLDCKQEIQSQIVTLQDDFERKKTLAEHELEDTKLALEGQLKELNNSVAEQRAKTQREILALQDDVDQRKRVASHEVDNFKLALESQLKELNIAVAQQRAAVDRERESALRRHNKDLSNLCLSYGCRMRCASMNLNPKSLL